MRFGIVGVIYIVVGVLVAAGIIGDHASYFENLDGLEEIAEMVIAVLAWPLVLLGVDINLGDSGGGGDKGGGGGDKGGGGGDKGGGKGGGGK